MPNIQVNGLPNRCTDISSIQLPIATMPLQIGGVLSNFVK